MIHDNAFSYTIIVDVKNIKKNSVEKWRCKLSFISLIYRQVLIW